MSIDERFNGAIEKLKTLTQRPSDVEFLEVYALFKQATVGDVNTDRPGMFDLKGKAKWDAWESKKGLSSDEAKTQYIALIEKLFSLYA